MEDVLEAINGKATNAENGEEIEGLDNWTPLIDVIREYITHPEYKLEGDVGVLKYRKAIIDNIVPQGKEAKKLENHQYDREEAAIFLDRKKTYKLLLSLKSKDAESKGIHKGNLSKIKKKIREGKIIKLDTPIIRKLLV